MNHLDITRKFIVLVLMSCFAMGIVVYSLFTSLEQTTTILQQELDGIALIKPYTQLIQVTQQHRGLSSVRLGNDKTITDLQATKASDVTKQLMIINEQLPTNLALNEDWSQIKSNWARIHKSARHWTTDESFTAHTTLIDQMLLFQIIIADQYQLTLDSEMRSYYLLDSSLQKLPNVLERLGQIRAYGAGILSDQQISDQQKITLKTLLVRLDDAVNRLKINHDKIARTAPELQDKLAIASKKIAVSTQTVIGLVAENLLLSSHLTLHPADFVKQSTLAIDKDYSVLNDALLPLSERILKARITQASHKLYTDVGIATLLFLMVIYFLAGICYTVIHNVKLLVISAQRIADGDLQRRIILDSNEEFGQIAHSFNKMADSFVALLEERTVADAALQLSERISKQSLEELKYQKIALDHHTIVAMTDMRGNITYANRKFIEISGYSYDELMGQNHIMLNSGYHPKGFFKEMYRTVVNGLVWHDEVCNRAKDGHLYWVDTTIAAIMGDNGKPQGYIAVRTDISERKHAEELAYTANRAKSEFLANMSHEIRTPLNAVIGLAQIGLRDGGGSVAGRNFAHIANAGKHLLTIINDILDISKIEAGKLSIEKRPFSLLASLHDVVNLVSGQAKAKNLTLSLSLAANLPEWVEGDGLRVTQIIVNLLSNAIKFTAAGEVCLTVSRDGDNIHFLVSDTGIGMSEEQLQRIFNPFEQADGSTTRIHGGTGLGLSISMDLARLMGGDIHVESHPDVGSCFEFYLCLPAVTAPQKIVSSDGVVGTRLQSYSILAADDVEMNRLVLEDILTHEGARVVLTENGEQLLKVLKQMGAAAFDVVLMDVQMPIMDGFDATREVCIVAPNLPVIGVTAHALNQEQDKCLAAGMLAVVTKPIDSHILVQTILQLAQHHASRTASAIENSTEKHSVINTEAPYVLAPPVSSNALIDWQALHARFNGNQNFIRKLATSILESYSEVPEKLRVTAQQKDWEALVAIAHNLKSVSGNLEAHQLYELAKTIEAEARAGEGIEPERVDTLALTLEAVLLELKNTVPAQ